MAPDHPVYLHIYRGYGSSEGKPSEASLFAEALALYGHLAARHDSIDVIGRSLGTGVAVFLASEREVRNLALAPPYDSITSLQWISTSISRYGAAEGPFRLPGQSDDALRQHPVHAHAAG